MYAVLKSREFEVLSHDMDFLYDRNTIITGDLQEELNDVVRNHGVRDDFEYLPAAKVNSVKVQFLDICSYAVSILQVCFVVHFR